MCFKRVQNASALNEHELVSANLVLLRILRAEASLETYILALPLGINIIKAVSSKESPLYVDTS